MKKILLSAFLLTSGLGFSQITIEMQNMPEVLDYILQARDTMPTVNAGSAGANQTYNLSGLQNPIVDTLEFTNPVWADTGNNFPTSNLALVINSNQTIFITKNPGWMQVDGAVADLGAGMMVLKNDDPETIINLPLNYLDSYQDTAVLDETIDASTLPAPLGSFDSVRLKQVHYRTYDVDGWGTLTTPLGTFDVLRQYDQDVQIDTVWGKSGSMWFQVSTSIDTSYRHSFWTDDLSTKFVLAELSYDASMTLQEASWLMTTPTTSVEEQSFSFRTYPNPVENTLVIDTDAKFDTYEIVDVTGKTVLTGGYATHLNVSTLNRGIYFVSLYVGSAKQTLKFIKH